MATNIRSGAAWRNCANGNLRIKSGGAWRVANFCYIKGAGTWRDSGYRGYPLVPGATQVYSWDFSTVYLRWTNPGAGGAPIASYHVVQTDGGGTWINQWTIPYGDYWNNPFGAIGVVSNQRMRFYVEAISAGGLSSGWAPSVGVQIGHAEQGHYANELRQRDWSNAVGFQGGLSHGETALVGVPNAVQMHTWRYIVGLTFPGPYVSKPTSQGNRQIYHVFVNQQFGEPFDWGGGGVRDIDTYEGFPYTTGQDTLWGIILGGIGWSDRSVSTAQMAAGALYVYGIEDYYVSVYYVDVAYQGNSYW